MSLALGLHTDTGEDLAGRMDANLTAIEHLNTDDIEVFAGTGANDLGKARDADTHQLTARPLFGLFTAQPFVIYVLHRQAQCGFIVPAVGRPVQSRTVGEGLRLAEVLETQLWRVLFHV